jgi:hypothetical protein
LEFTVLAFSILFHSVMQKIATSKTISMGNTGIEGRIEGFGLALQALNGT